LEGLPKSTSPSIYDQSTSISKNLIMGPVKAVLDEIEDICTKLKNALEFIEKPLEIINETDHVLSVVLRTLKTSRDAILLMEFIPIVGEVVMPIELVIVEVLFPLRSAKRIVHNVNKRMKKVTENLERIEERVDKVLEIVQNLEDAGDYLRDLKELLVTIEAMKSDSGDLANTHPFVENLKFSVGANGVTYSSVQEIYDEYEEEKPEHGFFRRVLWRFKEIRAMKSAMEDVVSQTDMEVKHDKTKAQAKDHHNQLTKHVKKYDKKMDNHISIIEKVHDLLIELTKEMDIVPSSKGNNLIEAPGSTWPYYPALFDTCYGLVPGEGHHDGKYGHFTLGQKVFKVTDPTLIHMLDPKLYSLSPRNGKKPEGLKAQGWQNDDHGHDYWMVTVHVDGHGILCGKYSDYEKAAWYYLDGQEIAEPLYRKNIQFVYPTPINERHDNKDFDYYSLTDLDFLDNDDGPSGAVAGAVSMSQIDLKKTYDIEGAGGLDIGGVGGLSKVRLVKITEKLNWTDAERRMKKWISLDPKNNIANYIAFTWGGYTVWFYKAEGVIQLKEQSGNHGVMCDEYEFKYLVNVIKY